MITVLWPALTVVLLAGCSPPNPSPSSPPADTAAPQNSFRILAGSENKTLQPLIERFASQNSVALQVDYLGSVDIMMRLQDQKLDYDAVWPANSLWIALGDKQRRVKDAQSVMWSPVVLGVKKSVAQSLRWVGRQDVKVEEILNAAESGKLRFMMTSATQSNSGASAYLGFLYAFAGRPQMLNSQNLASPQVRDKIRRILGSVNRSSGSSGWLKDLFLQKYDNYDGMINYEALVIEANQALVSQGKEPLTVIYPSDGLAIADSPLGYVDRQDAAKAKIFRQLQAYLLSAPVQQEILKLGRRVGPVGEELKDVDKSVFNPDWGINTSRFLNQIRYPKAETIREALDLYQSALRKPSFTVYCLDFSGSMKGEREEGLKSAMRLILNQDQAKQSLLQAAPNDVTVVITFNDHILNEWTVKGNDPNALLGLWTKVDASEPGGGTDIYSPVMRGFDIMKQQPNLAKYFPAVILMTDGESNTGQTFEGMQAHIRDIGMQEDIPVFAIQFGEASESQLGQIAEATSGKVFDGKSDLAHAFREAKGYN
jgi:Ca-activated chloride channel family protein